MSRPTVTVYCEAESHKPWERTYTRDDDGVWVPDLFDYVGGRARKPRRDGGMQFHYAGRALPVWNSGQSPIDAVDRMHWADAAAGAGTDELHRRYLLRCPECGESLPRSEANLNKQFDWLVSQGFSRVTWPLLRRLDQLKKRLPER